MPKQSGKTRNRAQHKGPQSLFVVCSHDQVLAKKNKLLPQFVFELGAVEVHGNRQRAKDVLPEKDPMPLSHVEILNGENVGRTFEFLRRNQQRRLMFLSNPPLNNGSDCVECEKRAVPQYTQEIYIGIVRVKFTGSG